MKKILVIMGTRPEAIKLAPVIHRLKNCSQQFTSIVITTGQHREMLNQVVKDFDLDIDYALDLMRPNQTLSGLTALLITRLSDLVEKLNPDLILVQGDTTTAFVGGLIGYYQQTSVGHIEAGLRTENKFAPFPEEMNRRVLGYLADYHFAPTKIAKNSLLKEGIKDKKITVTGNTVIDAMFYALQKAQQSPPDLDRLEKIISNGNKFVLITGHRRENFGKGFVNICQAIQILSESYPSIHFVYPVHLNPNVQKPVYDILGNSENIHLIPPMEYIPFIYLMSKSLIVLTDSGGIQEEAPSLGKPVIVMRDVTERPEAVNMGCAILVGTDQDKIVTEVTSLIEDKTKWNNISNLKNPYGDGRASQRIVNFLTNTVSR